MSRLTYTNKEKPGYYSPARPEVIIQKLGLIEREGTMLLDEICSGPCKYYAEAEESGELIDEICAGCPVTMLQSMIE